MPRTALIDSASTDLPIVDCLVPVLYIGGGQLGNQQEDEPMRFGERVKELRLQRKLTQQKVAEKVGVTVGYICKVEKERLQFGDYPSEKFIHKLADALQCDEDELLLLTDRVPPAIQMRVLERPQAFRRIAELDDRTLDRLLDQIESNSVHVKTP